MTSVDAPSPPVRPKLNLAPRSAAASSGSAPTASGKPSPFGAARPREAVIAERTGVAETEVLKKDASQFASLRLRLTGEQSDQKRGKESELAEAKKALAEAKELGDDAITRIAASRCAEVEAELSTLMANFEVRAREQVTHARRRTHVALRLRRQLRNTHVLERARPSADSTLKLPTHTQALAVQLAHEGGKRPSEQQRQGEGQPPRHGGGGGGGYEQRGGGGGYEGQRGGSNDDAFANFGGRNNRRGPPGGGGSEGGLDYGGAFGGRRGGGGGNRGDGPPPHEQGGYHGASGGHHYQDRD